MEISNEANSMISHFAPLRMEELAAGISAILATLAPLPRLRLTSSMRTLQPLPTALIFNYTMSKMSCFVIEFHFPNEVLSVSLHLSAKMHQKRSKPSSLVTFRKDVS
jgi:hypothetical protein